MRVTVKTLIFGLPTGNRISEVRLTLATGVIPAKELIAKKILQEVNECRAKTRQQLSGEYRSTQELQEGSAKLAPGAPAEEIQSAQQAFAARDYMIVVDERRITGLDEELTLNTQSKIEFIRIMPVVGG